MSKPKVLMFDFDGTLANSMPVAWNSVLSIAEENGYQMFSLEESRRLGLKGSLEKLGVPMLKVPGFSLEVSRRMKTRNHEVKLFDGVKEGLIGLREEGYLLAMVSSNQEENVRFILKNNEVDEGLFSYYQCGGLLFSKEKCIRKTANALGADLSDCIYVGDETRDLEACMKLNVPMIAVNWGNEAVENLVALKSDLIVAERFSEIRERAENLTR